MEYITNSNRDRNTQILQQAQELNSLLLANNIRAIFLKGTGNLLAGLYKDIAERMVGDIDFIFSKEDYPKAVIVLTKNGYSFVEKIPYDLPFRHYPRLKKKDRIAGIEIHMRLY
ncbi:nucleotidyltransferase family protein [uncultured Polaribacter sp.]|uniref:nucleotidyltransferase family protein n=1 Tax=uncultured Polaribacter sp. TaxID=174711 RepID=UPI003703C357